MELPEDFDEQWAAAMRDLDQATARVEALKAMIEAKLAEDAPEKRHLWLIKGGRDSAAAIPVLLFLRAHSRRIALATASTAAAGVVGTLVAVVAIGTPPAAHEGSPPPHAGLTLPASLTPRPAASVAPSAGVPRPSPTRTRTASSPAVSPSRAAVSSTSPAAYTSPPLSSPLLPSLPLPSTLPSLPALPVPPLPTPSVTVTVAVLPSPSGSPTCLVRLTVEGLLNVCA